MLNIGNLSFPSKVVLAPMAGVCDRPFRAMVRRFDQKSLIWGEMISSVGLFHWGKNNHSYLSIDPEEPPVALQIFGHEPAVMADAARRVCETEACLVDINAGCPAPKIVKNGDGAALMRDPLLFGKIVEAVVKASSKPVTVKLRLGWQENDLNFLEMAKIAEDCGAAAVTLHGRTRSQMYAGKADWEAITLAARSLRIPLIGNGDIQDPLEAREKLKDAGCAGIMVGRGAMGAPWVIGRISHFIETGELRPEPAYSERIDFAIEHSRKLIATKGERIAVPELRKHIAWYTSGMPQSAELRQKINLIASAKELYATLDFYREAQPSLIP